MSLFDIFKKPFKDVHNAVKSYENLYKQASVSIDKFEKNEDIDKNKYSESFFNTELKLHYLNMCESGLDLDHLIEIHVKKAENADKLAQFATTLQKHSIIELDEVLLSNKDIEIVSFPEKEDADVFKYANRLHAIYKDMKKTEIRIVQLKKLIESADSKLLKIPTFENCLKLNESNLNTFELEFMRELRKTKMSLNKTMNFFPLPDAINEDTIRFHAYIRKLIDLELFTKDQVFKRYTNRIPECLKEFEDKMGYFDLTEEQVQIVLDAKKVAA
jgi:hypothetical protein